MAGSFIDLKAEVLDQGLCTRCGGCAASCPVDAISFTGSGMHLTGDCISCGTCTSICPGGSMDLSRHEERLFGKHRKKPLGKRLGIYSTRMDLTAGDLAIFKKGYFGGRVSALLIHMLEERIIDAALLTDWSGSSELSIGKGIIARTREDVLKCASSKYVFSPVLSRMKDVRDDPTIGKAALVGLPCHIHAFRNMEVFGPTRDLTAKVDVVIGINCGAANLDEEGWRNLITDLTGVPGKEIASFRLKKISGSRIRMTISKRDGTTHSREMGLNNYLLKIPMIGVWPRCFMCPDYASDLSDITFGMPYIRTEKGSKIIGSALRSGALKRSGIKRRLSQFFIDLIIPLRKKQKTRKNIRERISQGLPYPKYN